MKGLIWCDLRHLVARLLWRHAEGKGQARFVRGDAAALASFAGLAPERFEMAVVQSGIPDARLAQRIAEVLAAANSHVVDAGLAELRVMGSARPRPKGKSADSKA